MNQFSLSRILNYLLFIVFLIACITSGLYLYSVQKLPKGTSSAAISHNLFFPERVSDSTIRYYTGNTFAELDAKSQKIKSLSRFQMIPDVTQVFWLESGVVFATQELNSFSDLQQVRNAAVSTDPESRIGVIPTYWYLSFTSNTIRALGTNVMQPDLYGIVATDGSFIYKDDVGTFSRILPNGAIEYGVAVAGDDVRPVYADKDSLTFIARVSATGEEENGGDIVEMSKAVLNKEGVEVVSENVFDDTKSTIYSQIIAIDQTRFLITHSSPDNKVGGDVFILDTTSNDRKKIIKEFEGYIVKDSKEVVAIKKGRTFNTLHRITASGVSERLRINQTASNISNAYGYAGGYIYVTAAGQAFIANRDKEYARSIKASYEGSLEKEITNLPDGISILRDIHSPYITRYNISFSNKGADALNTIRTAVRAKGHDPDQFTFVLTPGPSASY